jgi:hypothetical protein
MYYHPNEEEGVLPFLKQMKWISALSALFAVLLLIDFFLPANCSSELVLGKEFRKESTRFGSTSYDLKIHTSNFKFKVNPDLFAAIIVDSNVEVCHTPIMNRVKLVSGRNIKNNLPYSYESVMPIYRGFASFPIALLIASMLSLFFKQDDTVAYSFGIMTLILLISMFTIM